MVYMEKKANVFLYEEKKRNFENLVNHHGLKGILCETKLTMTTLDNVFGRFSSKFSSPNPEEKQMLAQSNAQHLI